MADGRITDYVPNTVKSGNIILPTEKNTERRKIVTSVNGGNNILTDLEQNYSGTSAPTSAPDGKLWHDSSGNYINSRINSEWSVFPHSGVTTNFAFGKGLTVASNFAVSGTAAFGLTISIPASLDVSGDFSIGGTTSIPAGIDVVNNFTVAGAASLASLDISGNFSVAGAASFAGIEVASNFAVTGTATLNEVVLDGTISAASGKGIDFSADSKGLFTGLSAIVYRLTADDVSSGGSNPLGATTGAWEISDDTENEFYLGPSTAVTESSGIFSFGSTGYWLIMFNADVSAANATGIAAAIYSTDNNSTYTAIATKAMTATIGSIENIHTLCFAIIRISDISNDKVKFSDTGSLNIITAHGDTGQNETCATFIKLADI